MKNETTKTVAPGVTLTDGVMVVDEAAMRRDFAMSCANALKAMQEGYRDLAEELAPGFVEWFLSHDVAGRKGILDGIVADLSA